MLIAEIKMRAEMHLNDDEDTLIGGSLIWNLQNMALILKVTVHSRYTCTYMCIYTLILNNYLTNIRMQSWTMVIQK